MKEDPFPEQSLQAWIDLFSDPALSLSAILEKGNKSEATFSSPSYLALWLDYFLVAGEEPVKEKWASLPLEEQIGLGVELLTCYIFQPLYIRLTKREKASMIKAPLKLESQGKFFRVEHGTGTNRNIELLYPLEHRRLWPDLFRIIPGDLFSSRKIMEAIQPGMTLSSFSRLEKIRQRVETLASFLTKGQPEETLPDRLPVEQTPFDMAPPITGDQIEESDTGDHSPEITDSSQSAPEIKDIPPSPLPPPKRKKKIKQSKNQMELF